MALQVEGFTVQRSKLGKHRSNRGIFRRGLQAEVLGVRALIVDTAFQRKGLGTRLVREGMREVERLCRGGLGEKEGREAEGVVLVANPAGRTHEGAGFELVGRGRSGGRA